MKSKLSFCCACVCGYATLLAPCHAVPGYVYQEAEAYDNSNYESYKPPYLYRKPDQSNYSDTFSDEDAHFVVEYQIGLFTSAKSVITLSNDYEKISGKGKATDMNNSGALLLGVSFSELDAQISFTAGRNELNDTENTNFGVSLRLPMTKGTLQPYMEASILHSTIDVDWVEDSISALGFGIEGGLLYNLTRNTFIRAGLAYSYAKFEEEESGVKGVLKNTSWTFNTGLGYRF